MKSRIVGNFLLSTTNSAAIEISRIAIFNVEENVAKTKKVASYSLKVFVDFGAACSEYEDFFFGTSEECEIELLEILAALEVSLLPSLEVSR